MMTLKKLRKALVSTGINLVCGLFNASLGADTQIKAPTTEMVVTILSDGSPVADIQPSDLKVYQGESRRIVTGVERLSGDRAAMELFIYLDNSMDSANLDAVRPQLEQFIRTLPETTKVAVGNSIVNRSFTADHENAAAAIRQSISQSEPSGTWSNLLALIRQWPGREQTQRRAVLIITAGVSPEYPGSTSDAPYVEAAWRNAQIAGIAMYSVLVSDQGAGARQTGLERIGEATGGYLYSTDAASRHSLNPFLDDLNLRLANQYRITFEPKRPAGAQRVSVQTDLAGGTVISSTGVYVRQRLLAAAPNHSAPSE